MSIRTLLLSLLFVASANAQTVPPDGLTDPLFPSSETVISTLDEVYVAYLPICGKPTVDPNTPVRQFMENGALVVELTLLPFRDGICFSAPVPTYRQLFSIGTLPKGTQNIQRRLMLRGDDGSVSLLYESAHHLYVGNTPNPALSGAWYDASNPGTGLFVSLLPRIDGDTNQEPLVVIYWAAEDENRQPVWYTGTGRFVDGRLDIDLTKGGAQPAVKPMRFYYQGCGKAHWVDPRFPTFFTELTQLTEVSGVDTCHPERLGPMLPR